MHIGILGAGQLGRMLALAGYPLGHSFTFFDQSPGESICGIGEIHLGLFNDCEALKKFAAHCDVITYEFENVPSQSAELLASIVPVYPPPRALEVSQDRITEKLFLQSLGVATPPFEAASSQDELRQACEKVGFPCIAKTRRFGYDGKGQARITDTSDLESVWRSLGGTPLIVEGFVQFARELSVIAARDTFGQIEIYPLTENKHIDGILYRSETPAPNISEQLSHQASSIATKILSALNYVGVIAIELFQVDDSLIANEMAPRVHNSGHATIDNGATSQFENHIRAITGMHLGSSKPLTRSVMYNLVGYLPNTCELSSLEKAKIHLYGKTPRAGRKVGHITVLEPTVQNEQIVSSIALRSKT